MLDKNKATEYIFNIPLAVYTGQYHLLDPNGHKIIGYNILHVAYSAFAIFIIAIMVVTGPLGIYTWFNDTNQLVMEIAIIINFTFASYKCIAVIRNSDAIWKFLDVTRVDFIGCGVEYLRKCRTKTTKVTYLYTSLCYLAAPLWVTIPYLIEDSMLTVKCRDGAYKEYKMNLFNMYIPISEVMINNEYYYLLHVLEIFLCLTFLHFTITFDTILICMCFSLASQLKTIGIAFSEIGHNKQSVEININTEINSIPNSNYDDLRNLIINHHRVFKKMEEFYNIFGGIILTQLAVASSTLVFLPVILIMNYYNGGILGFVQSLKMFSAVTVFALQLFLTCYLFGNIRYQNESINFSMYSSNWTEMDLNVQKLILLSMKINNSYQLEMKITNSKIVGLHLFVMRLCYSVVSVIVKRTIKYQ